MGGLPVYNNSGSGNSENSGNSLYAKVKDVALKEETAYAVVDCKDKDYDFVNGELVKIYQPLASFSTDNGTGLQNRNMNFESVYMPPCERLLKFLHFFIKEAQNLPRRHPKRQKIYLHPPADEVSLKYSTC